MGLSARPGIIGVFWPAVQHIYHNDALGYLNDSTGYRQALRPGARDLARRPP